jgi:putative component of toxin-antitoxin plasmid stabilization module
MVLRSDSKYPIHRAYVVKLSSDATPAALSGRIENLVSGQHREFSSVRELLRLLRCDLGSTASESPSRP